MVLHNGSVFVYFHYQAHKGAGMVAVGEQLLHSLVAPVATTCKFGLMPYTMLGDKPGIVIAVEPLH